MTTDVSPWRVLVIDDDDVDRMAARRALGRGPTPVVVDEAAGPSDALPMLAARAYDCVFLDYHIPGTDGLEVLRRIRQAGHTVPVIVLTGQGDEQLAVEAMKAGALDYLPKAAATPERVASSLRYAVDLWRAEAEARSAQEQLRASAERSAFLAIASAELASSLDVRPTLDRVARLAVPLLGDYCLIYLLDDGGDAEAVASAHADPAKESMMRCIERGFRPGRDHATSQVADVIRSGRTRVVDPVSTAHVESIAGTPEELEAYRALEPARALFVPLTARHVLGAAVFSRSAEQPSYSVEEIALAEDLARRAAMALDNALLFQDAQRARARTERLQRVTSRLATALPQDEVTRIFVDELREAFGASVASISLLASEGGELVTAARVGVSADIVNRFALVPADATTPTRDTVRDLQPRVFRTKAELTTAYPHLATAMEGVDQEALAVVPMSIGGDAKGVLTVGFRDACVFNAEDLALATALAQQCAQAVERARLYEAERTSRAAAEDANRAKSEFLARMSHDLRTPLNAIGGYAQLIEADIYGATTEGQRESLGRIRRAQQHLLMLINDILSFAKLEAGQVSLELDVVNVCEVLADLRPLTEPQVLAKGLTLVLDTPSTVQRVRADRVRVEQILINLVSNAVKFTEAGGEVAVATEPQSSTLAIHVRDTGCGIAPDRLAAIFDPFVQGPQRSEGVGLGLAISRELARLMNGELTVESQPGRGSNFTLTLPLAAEVPGT